MPSTRHKRRLRTAGPRRLTGALALVLGVALGPAWTGGTAALAQNAEPADPATRQQQPLGPEQPEAEGGSLWQRTRLLGDPGGLRSRLENAGYTLTLQETSEVLGNLSGGRKIGAVYEGATLMALDIDAEKAVGLPGGSFRASAYQIHGRGLSFDNIGNINTISSIEATRATRLFELWYEQKLFDDVVSLRVGQQSADLEFQVSTYAGLFVNASFGWPTLSAADLPSGGPAYPLATPAVRLKVQPRDDIALLVGVFSGDPSPLTDGDPQRRNASGTSFTLDRGVFVIGELQYTLNGGDTAAGLPGTYKVGAWYNSNNFDDQRFANDGLSLADPASSGIPRRHRNDVAVYAVADQLVWRKQGTKDQGVGVFGRVTGATNSDRNLVSLAVNVGATWKGAVPGREDDTVGLGFTYAQIGGRARDLDRDVGALSGAPYPRRGSESLLEVTYQAVVTPWLTLQPDFQYVFSPAGGVPNPDNPDRRLKDAAVLGLRGVVIF